VCGREPWPEGATPRSCGRTPKGAGRYAANNQGARPAFEKRLHVIHQRLLKFVDKYGSRGVQRLHDDEPRLQPVLVHDLIQIPRDVDQLQALARLVENCLEIELQGQR